MAVKASAYFVDCGLAYSGEATTTLTGLDHLEGEAVDVVSNGAYLGSFTVSGGAVTLGSSVTSAFAGLNYASTLKPMKLDMRSLGIALTKKITKAIISFYNTLGCKYGPNTDELDTVTFREAGNPMDASPPLFTGIKELSFSGSYEREGDIVIYQDQPLPTVIRGVVLNAGLYDGA